jgi:hypothetical protein
MPLNTQSRARNQLSPTSVIPSRQELGKQSQNDKMADKCILHRLPFEIRDLIYSCVISDLNIVEIMDYDISTKTTALDDMIDFERALIPDRQLYREVVSHKFRHFPLILKSEWPTRPVSWDYRPDPRDEMPREIDEDAPFSYPSVEDMPPFTRENIRKIVVEFPGYVICFRLD